MGIQAYNNGKEAGIKEERERITKIIQSLSEKAFTESLFALLSAKTIIDGEEVYDGDEIVEKVDIVFKEMKDKLLSQIQKVDRQPLSKGVASGKYCMNCGESMTICEC